MKLNIDIYTEVNQVISRLNNQHRWISMITEHKYNELSKQALNSMISYAIACYCENDGQEIKWERFPRIALYRAFYKSYVSYATPEQILKEICEIGNIDKSAFDATTRAIISERTDRDFMQFISQDCNTFEYCIFRAATKIATLIELKEQAVWLRNVEAIVDKSKEVMKSLEEFMDIKAVREFLQEGNPVFKIFQHISMLRNSNRWAAFPYIVHCNVLGHLFDTAIFAYFIGLEEFSGNEEIATKMFFMGIYHEIAESWTTDIPSDIKDRITGFREATEKFEDRKVQKNVYDAIPDFLKRKIKAVMFEEEDNLQYKKLMKGADYLSADSECWRQFVAGSRETYFLTSPIKGFDIQLMSGYKAKLPPLARELHDKFMRYAEQIVAMLPVF